MASNSLQIGEVRKVRIENIAFGGAGVGRIEAGGLVVFVPYTVTNDEVEVEIKEMRKKYALGIIKSIRAKHVELECFSKTIVGSVIDLVIKSKRSEQKMFAFFRFSYLETQDNNYKNH